MEPTTTREAIEDLYRRYLGHGVDSGEAMRPGTLGNIMVRS